MSEDEKIATTLVVGAIAMLVIGVMCEMGWI